MITFENDVFEYHLDNKVVGWYNIKYSMIMVDKAYRQRGIGTALVSARLELEPCYKANVVTMEGYRLFSKFDVVKSVSGFDTSQVETFFTNEISKKTA